MRFISECLRLNYFLQAINKPKKTTIACNIKPITMTRSTLLLLKIDFGRLVDEPQFEQVLDEFKISSPHFKHFIFSIYFS